MKIKFSAQMKVIVHVMIKSGGQIPTQLQLSHMIVLAIDLFFAFPVRISAYFHVKGVQDFVIWWFLPTHGVCT